MSAINKSMFINRNELTEEEFKKAQEDGNIVKSFSTKAINLFVEDVHGLIEKGGKETLTEEENNTIEKARKDLSTLKKMVIVKNDLSKEPIYCIFNEQKEI
jgi:hypothetical protein